MPDVVVVGDANADLVLHGDVVPRFGQAEQLLDGADFVLGGSGAIVACGLARLGVDVAIVAAVGADDLGSMVTGALRERGVSTGSLVVRDDVATGLSVILNDADPDRGRAILTFPGAIGALSAGDVDERLLAGARHVHSASRYLLPRLAPDLPRLLAAATAAGATVSVDTNDDPARAWDGLADLLAAADVALPNEGELAAWARVLAGASVDPEDAAASVAERTATVVVKRGGDGASLVTAAGETVQRATPVEAIDTTGAGDSFDAGWIAAILAGLDPADALRWAVAAGGLSTRGAGGIARQGDRSEVEAAAAALPPPGADAGRSG